MLPRAERRALQRLPTSTSRWQVGLVDVPARVEGVDLEGVLLVVEEGSGRIRGASPVLAGAPLWPVLRNALHSPSPPSVRARPRALLCADPELAARLRRELDQTEIQVQLVDRLPELDHLAAELFHHLAPTSPGLTVELPRWATTLALLCRLAPWERLPDRFAFRFGDEIPELAPAVAVVLGLAGEQEGVVLYPTVEAFERFQASAVALDGRALAEGESTCLFLDDAGEFGPSEQAELRRAGLALPGGRLPQAIRLHRGEILPLSEREQRVLLAAVEGIVQLCAIHLEQLLDAPCSAVAQTCLGPVTVRSAPSEPAAAPARTLASDHTHAVIVTEVLLQHEERPAEEIPALVVKLVKRDAERLARQVSDADAVQLEDVPVGLRARLFAGARDLGLLCEVPVDRALASRLRAAPSIMVAVSAGGVKRHTVREQDILWSGRLSTRRADGGPRQRRHDPIFDRPPSEWPKASETLILYAHGVFGPVMDAAEPEEVLEILQMASAVWSAVVLADYCGKDEALAAARQSGAPPAMIDALVKEKRQQWPGDPRLIADVKLKWRGKEPRYVASSAVPAGYELGSGPR